MPEKTTAHRPMRISRPFLLAIGGVMLMLAVGVWATASGLIPGDRVVGIGVIVSLLGLAWIDNRFEMIGKVRPWRELAAHTDLTCRVSGLLTGHAVQVVGTYRGRAITLYTPKKGKGQVQMTRIELAMPNTVNAALRLRGPFHRDDTHYDPVTSGLFATTSARQFGNNQRFFIRSQPLHIATSLLSHPILWDNLGQLDALVSIELDGRNLVFEQIGVLTDVAKLHGLFDLLSELADIIEQQTKKGTTVSSL